MSEQVIDERVVSMKFDNKEFEKNAAQSLSTIQKLKQALNFKDASKNLDEVKKVAGKFNLSGVTSAIDSVKSGFSAMEVAGITAIANITNKFVNAASQWVKSVTIDPVSTGLTVYEQKLNSVQTMLNNSGEGLGKVTQVLDDLNEYSDKTIFSLNDMTTALGKFTAQGVGLEQAARIIRGAANEAASMGAGSAEFSRFIYNLTQAYGMGKMTTIDWKSLENAGVAGKEFKEQLIASYEELAKMGKVTDKFVGQLTAANLREHLQDGVITAEVMTHTFEKYADETTDLGKKAGAAAKEIKTFHQLLDVLAESVASTWSQSFGYIIGDFYEAKQLWTNVSKIFEQTVGKMNENRNKLLKAWKEGFIDPAKTSAERLKELEQAQRTVANIGGDDKISGRTMLLDSLANVLQALLQVVKPLTEAFREFFPALNAKGLWEATKAFREFTSHLKLSQGAIKEIKDAFRGFFAIMNFGKTLLKDIIGALIPATKEADSLGVIILKIAGFLGRLITKTIEAIRSSDTYQTVLQGITYYAKVAIKIIVFVITKIAQLIKLAKESGAVNSVFQVLTGVLGTVLSTLVRILPAAVTVFKVIAAGVGMAINAIGNGLSVIEKFVTKFFGKSKEGDKSGKNIVAGVAEGIADNAGTANKAMNTLADGMTNTFKKDMDISSPSGVFMALGAFLIAGLVLGIAKSAGLLSESENQILQFIGNIGKHIADGAANIKKFFASIFDDSSVLVTHMETAETHLANTSVGLLDRVGAVLRKFIGSLRSVNVAAIVVVGIIGTLLFGIIRIVSAFYNLGRAVKLGMKAADNISKGFNNFAKGFKRMHSPLVETLKGVAICIMGITASIWLLSTLKDTGKLAPALATLLISFAGVLAVIVGAAAIVDKYDLEDDVKNLAMMVLSLAGTFFIVSLAFENIVNTMSKTTTTANVVLGSLGVIFAILLMMTGFSALLAEIDNKQTIKGIVSILAFTYSTKKILDALVGLIDSTKGLRTEELKGLWLGGIFPIFTLMLGVAGMGLAFKDTGVGSALVILTMIFAIKKIIEALGNVPWNEVAAKVNEMHNTIVWLGSLFVILVSVFASSGTGLKDFGKGLIEIIVAIGGMILLCKLMEKLQIPRSAITQTALIAAIVAGLAVVLIAALHFMDVPVGKFGGFVFLLLALDTVMLTLAKVVTTITSAEWNSGVPAFKEVSKCLAGLIFMLALLAVAMVFTKDAPVGKFALVIVALTTTILAVAALARAMETFDGQKIAGLLSVLTFVFVGLGALLYELTKLKKDTPTKPILAIVGGLIAILGGLVLLTTIPDTKKLAFTTIMLTVVMLAFAGLILAVSEIKKDTPTGPLYALVLGIVAITASLWLLSKYSWDQLIAPVAGMAIILGVLAGIVVAMRGLTAESTGPMLVAVIAILAVAASLSLLAYLDWPGLLEAAESMALVLGAVAACLWIVSTAGGTDALKASGAIVIVSIAMIVLAKAMQEFVQVPWETVVNGSFALIALTAAIALLALIGKGLIEASFALLIGSAAIVVMALALQQLVGIPWETFGMMAATLGTIAGIMVLLSILTGYGSGALVVGIALVIASVGLIAVAKALQMLAEVNDRINGEYLSDIAGGLMAMGAAGIVLTVGGAGLIVGGIGLIIVAGALKTMGEVDPSLTGERITSMAEGLMAMGAAGIVLAVGAAGLIVGGIGLGILGAALWVFNSLRVTGKKLSSIADAVMDFAKAGIAGVIGGPGLMLLSIGMSLLCNSLRKVAQTSVAIYEIDFARLAEDAYTMGMNVVQGLEKGLMSGLDGLSKISLMLAYSVRAPFENELGIASPSKWFKKLGQWILQGLGIGISDETLNSGLKDTMKAVADNILSSFTSEMGMGFDKIGDLFSGGIFGSSKLEEELKEQKKLYNELLAGRDSYYKKYTSAGARASYEKRIGTVASKIAALESQIAQNSMSNILSSAIGFDFSSIASEFTSLFDSDNFTGLEGLSGIFDDLDFSVDGVTDSLQGMNIAATEVDMSNTSLTNNMAKSIDVFSEYDRSLTVTTKDIKKNLLENLVGEGEFQANLNNLAALNFDPKLIAEIGEKGKESGNSIAAALLAGANEDGEAFVKWYNERYAQAQLYANGTQLIIDSVKDAADNGKSLEEYGFKWMDSTQYIDGSFSTANSNYDASKWTDLYGQQTNDALAAQRDELARYDTETEKNKDLAIRKVTQDSNEEVADQAIADLSESIKASINRYMPASSFADLGKNICLGVASGIWGYMYLSERAIQMTGEELITAFARKINSNSPSKVFEQFGQYIQEGLAKGIDETDDATKSTKEMGDSLLGQFLSVIQQIDALMQLDDTWQPTIRPVVDFTNIEAGAIEAQRLMSTANLANEALAAGRDIQVARGLVNTTPTLSGMSREEFRMFLNDFASTIVDGIISNDGNPVNVNVNLEGDAAGIFKVVKEQNTEYKRTKGRSALA